ncbi:MAG: zinc ABC transporter substrate-binding protein [Butyrivibrio sp.]|nr:zinc ABC transporter substrate-binding protein [Butyrivibrio sp.]
MKKITVLVLAALAAVLALAGCAGAPEVSDGDGRLCVVSTIFAPYDFVRQIAGERVENSMLLKPGTDAHSYEPTPQDIIRLQKCDLFIYVGGENDAWVEDILSSMDTSSMRTIKLLDCVEERYEEEFVEGMDGGHSHEQDSDSDGHEPENAEWDEHVWTSPVNAALICEEIAETLTSLDSANADAYRSNTEKYVGELKELDADFRLVTKGTAGDTLVFGDRFPLRYFVEEYGLKYYAAFPGCASETEASAATVAFLIDEVKRDKIPIVFKIELSNENMARTVAEESGARVETFYTGHNLSRDDFENGETYVTLMRRNMELLKEALG